MNNKEPDEGSRGIIRFLHQKYYILSFPFADKDFFEVKFPYENRPDNLKIRRAIDEILEEVNIQVEGIHEHYNDILDKYRELYKERGDWVDFECADD